MDYIIFAISTLVLSASYPHWDPLRHTAGSRRSRALGTLGTIAHVGGAIAIGWTSGVVLGLGAAVLIPITASVIYSVLIRPLSRSRRLERGRSKTFAVR